MCSRWVNGLRTARRLAASSVCRSIYAALPFFWLQSTVAAVTSCNSSEYISSGFQRSVPSPCVCQSCCCFLVSSCCFHSPVGSQSTPPRARQARRVNSSVRESRWAGRVRIRLRWISQITVYQTVTVRRWWRWCAAAVMLVFRRLWTSTGSDVGYEDVLMCWRGWNIAWLISWLIIFTVLMLF